jgi:squamous cell carcinoma antigen recognized by T-cells 3
MIQEAGKLLLQVEPILFEGKHLVFVVEDSAGSSKPRPTTSTKGPFVPRTAGSRPKAGLGFTRKGGTSTGKVDPQESSTRGGPKSQDDFRKMLG